MNSELKEKNKKKNCEMWNQNCKKRVKKTELWDVNSELQEKIKKTIVRCELRIARKE